MQLIMIRQYAKELFPIIKAFAFGANIQYRRIGDDKWNDVNDDTNVAFNSSGEEYRIKPEPKYRPFQTKEECWNEMLKHQPFGYIANIDTARITQITDIYTSALNEVIANLTFSTSTYDMNCLFNNFTFTDGTPFGIKEE